MILPSNLDDTIPVVCNVGDSEILTNIRSSSFRSLPWLQMAEPHSDKVLIVGGGPSVRAFLPTIKALRESGAKVFAMNGTMKLLNEAGCGVDYFILLDARPESVKFVTNGTASEYLIASQCPPEAFDAVEPVTLWHPNYEGVREIAGDRECVFIGGGSSVGLQSMSIAYAMGFREIHLYGFDSSYLDGAGHAYAQAQNDADQPEEFMVGGKAFLAAPWMARQAIEFQTSAQQLADGDATVVVHGTGLLPTIAAQMAQPVPEFKSEKEKYEAMWGFDQYREASPGEGAAADFVKLAGITDASSVLDFGCGTGRGGAKIHEMTGAIVDLVDFADNALDPDIELDFISADLSKSMRLSADFGFCCDVLEHIPTHQSGDVIKNIMECVDHCFFQISTVPDNMGVLIGQPLHLSVFPHDWWVDKFQGYAIDWSHQTANASSFYISKH